MKDQVSLEGKHGSVHVPHFEGECPEAYQGICFSLGLLLNYMYITNTC